MAVPRLRLWGDGKGKCGLTKRVMDGGLGAEGRMDAVPEVRGSGNGRSWLRLIAPKGVGHVPAVETWLLP